MTTFARVRKNIERDMAGQRVHTSESWAGILMRNTNRLTDEGEQAKFWAWLQNPEDDEREPPTLVCRGDYKLTPETVTASYREVDDEKAGECQVELENTYTRHGFTLLCQTKPL